MEIVIDFISDDPIFKIISKKDKVKPILPKKQKAIFGEENKKESDESTVSKLKKLKQAGIHKRIPKKEKLKLKKEDILVKIDLTQRAFKADKERKKREKTVITGDMKPMLDSLPSLEELFQLKTSVKDIKTGVPKYDKKIRPKTKRQLKVDRVKKKSKEFLERYQKVKNVMNDQKYKKNPRALIAEHLRKTRHEQIALLKSLN